MRVAVDAADIGKRVTLRLHTRAAPGEPAFTDLVGELLSWGPATLRVRRRDGSVSEVAIADLVAARVVPPPRPRGSR